LLLGEPRFSAEVASQIQQCKVRKICRGLTLIEVLELAGVFPHVHELDHGPDRLGIVASDFVNAFLGLLNVNTVSYHT
jgi:hypothetical protein